VKKKSKIVSSDVCRKREKLRIFNFGELWPFVPCEAHTPDLTLACYSPGGPEKNGLCSRGIGPHLGEIFRADFGGLWPPNPSSQSSPTDIFHRPWIVLGNGEKDCYISSLQVIRFCTGSLSIWDWGHFRGFPTSGVGPPIWPMVIIALGPWQKKDFVPGESAPIGGDMGIWNFAILAFFRTLTAIFSKTGCEIFTKFLQSTDGLARSNLWKKIKNLFVES